MRQVLLLLVAGSLIGALGPERTLAQDPRVEATELIAVYIGATSCGPCIRDETKEVVRAAHERLRAEADENGWEFFAVGVSLDWEVEPGFELLKSTADFDEIAVGRNWRNGAAIEYIWKYDDLPALPQVFVFKRTVVKEQSVIRFGSPEVLHRFLGADALRDWLEGSGDTGSASDERGV